MPRRKYEDQVAGLFETLRTKRELPPLTRIRDRKSLEELVCAAAVLDKVVCRWNSSGAVMYRTDNLATVDPDLERIAGYKDLIADDRSRDSGRRPVADRSILCNDHSLAQISFESIRPQISQERLFIVAIRAK